MIKKKEIIELLQDMEDSDPCELDHHGNCQAHGWADMKAFPPWRECPQKRLKEILREYKKLSNEKINIEKLINDFGNACLKAGKSNSGFCFFVTGSNDLKRMEETRKILLKELQLIIYR